MTDKTDSRGPASDGADWAFLALTPILLAATMLAAAAAFADAKTETPVAAVEAPPAATAALQN